MWVVIALALLPQRELLGVSSLVLVVFVLLAGFNQRNKSRIFSLWQNRKSRIFWRGNRMQLVLIFFAGLESLWPFNAHPITYLFWAKILVSSLGHVRMSLDYYINCPVRLLTKMTM